MWPFTKHRAGPLWSGWPRRFMRCGTPLIWSQRNNPNFCIRSVYLQRDGSTIIKEKYPYDGRQETRVVPKGRRGI